MRKDVEIIGGNLLDFPTHCVSSDKYVGINCIAHSCNTRNTMGAGIALKIKDRFPQAYEADTEFHMGREYEPCTEEFVNPLGKYSKAEVKSMVLPNDKGIIYNLYTQADVGVHERQVDYEAFWQASKSMQEDLLFIQHETGEPQVLGLPYGISCGLAGGNWKIIKAIIEDIFLDSLIQCYIVKYDDLGKDSPADWRKSSFERTQ